MTFKKKIMDDWLKKEEAKIKGVVKNIYEVKSFNEKPPKQYIEIQCTSEVLEKKQTERFNFSQSWQKINLKIGDKVEFLATIKTTTLIVHKDTRRVDSWGVLPFELTDYEDVIEIQSPKKITKVTK